LLHQLDSVRIGEPVIEDDQIYGGRAGEFLYRLGSGLGPIDLRDDSAVLKLVGDQLRVAPIVFNDQYLQTLPPPTPRLQILKPCRTTLAFLDLKAALGRN
jgi:hypothetical protein